MTTRIGFVHRTDYRFPRPVTLGPHLIRLRPAPHNRTTIASYSLEVEPKDHRLHWQQDPFGNWQARVFFMAPASRLQVTVDIIAELAVVDPFDFFVEPEATTWPFAYDQALLEDLAPYLETAAAGPKLQAMLESIPRTPRYTVDFLVDLNRRLATSIGYVVRLEPGIQTLEETLSLGSGSCRDTSWLLVQLYRHLGIAARFVSGYLIQLAGDPDGSDGPAEDIPDLHAWAEVFLPGAGWIGLDPTSGMLTGEGHIPLAASPRPDHAAPITGTTELPSASFEHEMVVHRLGERPRPLRPFLADTWSSIDALARTIDQRLHAVPDLEIGRVQDGVIIADWAASLTNAEGSASSTTDAFRLDGLPASSAPSPIVVEAAFEARPDLLGSLIRCWQRHPALSYMFSGGRIGSEGSAPRADELAGDRLADLDLALRLLRTSEAQPDDGLGDLLTDATGRSAGAELAFDAAQSRLAINAFGLAPEPRMALLEELLVRALALRFWHEPCRSPLVAHGAQLHDRFMLPYWLAHDLGSLLAGLASFGLTFEPAWFDAQQEYRFPLLGRAEIAGVRLELRAALEPPRLLRSRTKAGVTGRLVDDSCDRLQLLVQGDLPSHLTVTCNGWTLPLAPTPGGALIAGIRFRARHLPAMLHPTIGVQSPLTFDLVDQREGRSLGGCRYHATKPDGGAYDVTPINDLAAESRRLARFEPMRHTAGMMQPRRLSSAMQLPHTLDLLHAAG
jgi:transglutaminase-like putative cysteine protease